MDNSMEYILEMLVWMNTFIGVFAAVAIIASMFVFTKSATRINNIDIDINDLINSNMEEEIAQLRKDKAELKNLIELFANVEHERGGMLVHNGQLYYKVPESLFESAELVLMRHEIARN